MRRIESAQCKLYNAILYILYIERVVVESKSQVLLVPNYRTFLLPVKYVKHYQLIR